MNADGLSRIAMSSGLAASLSRATEYARVQGHAEVALEHMLLALCDDPDAVLVLAASNVNVAELTGEIGRHLAMLPARSQGKDAELIVASDLRRILEAAAAAARGGRRREINGAIVLAAIIGDGKSAAAQVLSGLGLTFEGAIRALQSRTAPAPGPETSPRPLPPTNAESILADARERVQSRTVTAPPRRQAPIEEQERAEPEPLPEEPFAEEPHFEEYAPLPPEPDLPEPAPMPEPVQVAPPPPVAARQPAPRFEPQPLPEPAYAPPQPSRDAYFEELPPQGYARNDYEAATYEAPAYDAPAYESAGYEPEVAEPLGAPVYEDLPPPMPAPPPFPPPIPAPNPHEGWTPPPGPQPVDARPGLPNPRLRGPVPPVPPPPASFEPRPGPPPLAPWPEQEHTRGPGQAFGAPAGYDPNHRQLPPQTAPRASGRQAPQRGDIGQLVENIPRSMRVAVPAQIEVRIARASVKALAEGLQGGGAAYQHEVMVTKAMSVRLRAPDGGFYIETASPETQWIERAMLLSEDDFASWRWHVTPRDTGRRRLQLVISARTVSAGGLAAETALPDQVITVRVRTNYAQVAARWVGWGVAAVAGGLLAKFGEGAFALVGRMLFM